MSEQLQNHTKFEQEFGYKPNRTQARRFQRNTHMKYSIDDVLLYKDKLIKPYYVIAMLWASGRSQTQIAAELSLKVGTVKSRTHRAFKKIEKLKVDNTANV